MSAASNARHLKRRSDFDVERFTEGDCYILARAIHLRTGWPICAFDHRGQADLHVFVRMPDGRLLDIEGPRSVRAFRARWRATKPIREFPWAEFKKEWNPPAFGRYSYDRARVLAPRILEEVGYA